MDEKFDKKALIVGAGSQDGILLSEKLTNLGWKVLGIQNPNSQKGSSFFKGKTYKLNFIDNEICSTFLDSYNPNIIYNFATYHSNSINMKTFENKFKDEIYQVNFNISKNIIDWQKKSAKKCKSVIALSSKMYDSINRDAIIDLNSPYNPTGAYGESKVLCYEEIKFARKNYGIDSIGLILFNHTSKYSKSEFLIPTLAKKIHNLMTGKVLEIEIDRSNYLIDISEAEDFVEGFISLCYKNYPVDYIFSSGKTISIKEVVTSLVLIIDFKLLEKIKFNESAPGNAAIYGNIAKTKESLNWTESKNIMKTFKEMVAAFEN